MIPGKFNNFTENAFGNLREVIATPLGEDVLLFHRMSFTEELGRLFQIELDLLSKDAKIPFEKILGQNVTIRLNLLKGQIRYFNGFVSRFSQEGTIEEFQIYSATLHPWLWFLTRTSDCRIFPDMTVPDIIKRTRKRVKDLFY